VGHFSEHTVHAKNVGFGISAEADTIFDNAFELTGFEDFSEQIPGTGINFDMIAIEGGSFLMGSPSEEKMRDSDEGPQIKVELTPFYIGKLEVSWDEYLTFFTETSSEGRLSEEELNKKQLDGITGPTPPWGAPDQGWGKGKMPAMSMSHYAATVYCEWLSMRTGKRYRLPTEAEWEYACRAGTSGAYFFEGTAADYSEKGFIGKIFGTETDTINNYVIYEQNSLGRTSGPGAVLPNPFGLKHTLGNVAEFCSDYYQENTFSLYEEGVRDPKGPDSGEEHVIKGGSYRSDAGNVRCASREPTQTKAWLNTDPQMPKSKWWYSDQNYVGFRVVCEPDGDKGVN
jgi:formylglycine-generating enzyme required for sulfatase activity